MKVKGAEIQTATAIYVRCRTYSRKKQAGSCLERQCNPERHQCGMEAEFFRSLTKPIKENEFMGTLNMALEYAENTDVSE
jgi:hypothetical protein